MTETILILGGTREAADLAAELVRDHPDWRVVTSLAGRTREPKPIAGEVRIGGFGGAEGLADYLRGERVTRLVDATHPFARTISENAKRAAQAAGVRLETRMRPPWRRQPDDMWTEVASLEEARDAIPAGARVLLALGRQHIDMFAKRPDAHFLVRMVDPPEAPLPLPDHAVVTGLPGDSAQEEATLLVAHAITHVVCRNSGGAAYAKIEAARILGLPVIMIGR